VARSDEFGGLTSEEIFELIGASMRRHDEIRSRVKRLEIEASGVRKNSRAYKSRMKAIQTDEKRAVSIARASRKLNEMYVRAKAAEQAVAQKEPSRKRDTSGQGSR